MCFVKLLERFAAGFTRRAMLAPIAPLILLGAFLLFRSRKAAAGAAGGAAAPSVVHGPIHAFPVREIDKRGGFGSRTRNSLTPTFAIASDHFRIKIFRESVLLFADVRDIDLSRSLIGSGIITIKASHASYRITVADPGVATSILRALPASLPFSRRAAEARG